MEGTNAPLHLFLSQHVSTPITDIEVSSLFLTDVQPDRFLPSLGRGIDRGYVSKLMRVS